MFSNRFLRKALRRVSVFLIILVSACHNDDDAIVGIYPSTIRPDQVFYGLTASNTLIRYNTSDPAAVLASVPILNLPIEENILAIDFRPATGQLYGLGSSSRIWLINASSGNATAIGSAPFSPLLSGTIIGFDFNPVVDLIRVVTASGQNMRINPETGAVVSVDTDLNPGTPSIGAVAYDNNTFAATETKLYAIDFATAKLYTVDAPNSGTLTEIGSLNVTPDAGTNGELDIAPDGNLAVAALTVSGTSGLYRVNLSTGNAERLGTLSESIRGIAIPTRAVAYAVSATGNLQVFNPTSIGTPVEKIITGLQSGESIEGIDFRPVNGVLYALGSTGRLYTLRLSTGAATAVNAAPFATLSGAAFGFDFNPVVDRIRIMSDTGMNLRVNPDTGELAATDTPLSPGTPSVTAIAYSNNFIGAASTTLFMIDSGDDMLYRSEQPNSGILTPVGNLGIDALATNGFDIGSGNGTAYAILSTAAGTKLYTINVATGVATELGAYPNAVTAFSVAPGF